MTCVQMMRFETIFFIKHIQTIKKKDNNNGVLNLTGWTFHTWRWVRKYHILAGPKLWFIASWEKQNDVTAFANASYCNIYNCWKGFAQAHSQKRNRHKCQPFCTTQQRRFAVLETEPSSRYSRMCGSSVGCSCCTLPHAWRHVLRSTVDFNYPFFGLRRAISASTLVLGEPYHTSEVDLPKCELGKQACSEADSWKEGKHKARRSAGLPRSILQRRSIILGLKCNAHSQWISPKTR